MLINLFPCTCFINGCITISLPFNCKWISCNFIDKNRIWWDISLFRNLTFKVINKKSGVHISSEFYSYVPPVSPYSSPLRHHKHTSMMAATRTYLNDGLDKPLNFDYSLSSFESYNTKINSSPF